jgi:ribosome recycling factor
MPMQAEYKEVREFKYPGMKIRVYIPNLTPEERSRRMKQIHNQAAKLLKEG